MDLYLSMKEAKNKKQRKDLIYYNFCCGQENRVEAKWREVKKYRVCPFSKH